MITRTVIVLILCACVSSLKILALFPYTGKSHHYVIDPLITALADKGHDITVVSHFPPKIQQKNRKDIILTSEAGHSEDVIDLADFEEIPKFLSMLQVAVETEYLFQFGQDICEVLLSNKEVLKLVHSGQKFDIALIEQFNSDCLLGIVHKIGAPSIGITSDTLMPWHYARLGAMTNPSYVPCHALGYGTEPRFFEVITSWAVCSCMRLGYYFRSTLPTQKIISKYLGDNIPPLDTLSRKISMVMTNSYFPLHGSFPQSPNIKEVGGLYLRSNNTLPDDLREFIDQAPHGVIYFSFGSMIKASSIPPLKLKEFQDAFSELPQRVLWKWENDSMVGKPDNVMVRKWLPQFDILNHHNVKVFISHAGMLSTTEAAHCGVTMLNIPMYGDQFVNAAAVEESGLGTVLHFRDITKDNILAALRKILDPKFQASAMKLSAVWKDRPIPALDTAVFWVEHVARHGGDHLRPASADLPLYRYLLLDVVAFISIALFICVFIYYKILVCLLSYMCGTKKKTKKE